VLHGFDGKSDYSVRGIDTLDVVYKKGSWWIERDYSEWDSVAYLEGIGSCGVCKNAAGLPAVNGTKTD
jgi:hypothetical protein